MTIEKKRFDFQHILGKFSEYCQHLDQVSDQNDFSNEFSSTNVTFLIDTFREENKAVISETSMFEHPFKSI